MMQKALPIVFLYSYPEDTRFSVRKPHHSKSFERISMYRGAMEPTWESGGGEYNVMGHQLRR
jgi:hypothetical protein